jgi:hypothetical protein
VVKPYSDLTGIGASQIYRTFVVSKEQAARIAEEYVDLIEAHGGSPGRFSAQRFSDLLIKELARRHEWRDPAAKVKWEKEQLSVSEGYNQWIESSRPSPYKKW